MNSAATVDNLIANWKASGTSKAEICILTAEACIGWPYVYGERGAYCTPALRRNRASALDAGMPAEAAVIRKGCKGIDSGNCSGCKWYPGGMKVLCFDCRGFTYWVLQQVGITITGVGATSQWNTAANWSAKGTIDSIPNTVCCVFMNKGKTMEHTGLYVGGGKIIHCSGEVKVGSITDKGWTHWAVPVGMDGGDLPVPTPSKPTLRKGSAGTYVEELQSKLIALGYDLGSYGADGRFGAKTETAVKDFQRSKGLTADGIVGPKTWEALEAEAPGSKLYTVTIKHLTQYEAEGLKARYDGAVTIEGESD